MIKSNLHDDGIGVLDAVLVSVTNECRLSSNQAMFIVIVDPGTRITFCSPGVATCRFSVFCYLQINHDLT